ncbi:IS630 family transposase, partial [Bacillus cereus]
DYEKGKILCMEEERFDAKVFLSFLHQVLKQYPEGKIVMVLDNARIHHAKLIQPFLEKYNSRLELVFLPPYSPNLNPIEGLWKWLKSSIIYNVFYTSVAEIRKAVREFIQKVNQQPQRVIDRL